MSYPAGRSRLANRLLAAIWVSGALCAGSAIAGLDEPGGWRALYLGAAVLLAALAIGHNLCDDSAGRLRFDGQYWSLSEASSSGAGRMQVCLDLQVLMLVRLTEPGRPRRWLWLERDADAQHWRDLRRAAYSHVPAASDAGDAASLSSPGGRHSSP